MSVKSFLISNRADRQLSKLSVKIQQRIIGTFFIMRLSPLSGIKLRGELSGYRKYRVGDYRIVYRFDSKEGIVIVVKIEHRQGVYR